MNGCITVMRRFRFLGIIFFLFVEELYTYASYLENFGYAIPCGYIHLNYLCEDATYV